MIGHVSWCINSSDALQCVFCYTKHCYTRGRPQASAWAHNGQESRRESELKACFIGQGLGLDALAGKASVRLKLPRRAQVHYHGSNMAEAGVHTVRLPKESTAADVCETLRRQLPEDGRPARLRLLEVFYSKIYKARAWAPCFACALGLTRMFCQRASLAGSCAGAFIMPCCTLVLCVLH